METINTLAALLVSGAGLIVVGAIILFIFYWLSKFL